MKKILATLIAGALVVPMVPAAAQMHPSGGSSHDAGPGDRRDDNRGGQSWHRFKKGEKFSRSRAHNYARLDYRKYKRLSAPPRGYVWVRSGDDALLVRLTTNVISRVILDIF